MQIFFGNSARGIVTVFIAAVGLSGISRGQNNELQSAIDTIKQVQAGGKNHEAAIAAMRTLNAASANEVPQLLEGMDGANTLARNWLRGAIQTALGKGGSLPRSQIQAYLDNKSRSHMGRLMAFELLTENDQTLARKVIPSFLDDPSLPLRQMAVDAFIEKAKQTEDADSIGSLGFALKSARDVKQIQAIAKLLGERGISVDLKKQLGLIPNWHIVGPFDNSKGEGFNVAYGPEKNLNEIDLEASYDDGKEGKTVKWHAVNSVDSGAVVDLNEVVDKIKGATAYAYTEFESEEDQSVDIRIGCINGNKVWVNGQEVLNNEIYHVGMMVDQFTGQAKLKKGNNQILFKVCQNEQTQPWANNWMFQLRVCQADGKAVLPYQKPTPQQ